MAGFDFSHRDHLRLAWDVIERRGAELAPASVGETLRILAILHGQPNKYNETLTQFWVHRVSEARDASSGGAAFATVLADHPHLLDSSLPLRHWSPAGLAQGRESWVEPDREPLPSAEKPTS